MKKIITAFCLFILCLPYISIAHPGHGESGGFTITHYFTEPIHVIISLSVLLVAVVYIRHLRRNKQTNRNS